MNTKHVLAMHLADAMIDYARAKFIGASVGGSSAALAEQLDAYLNNHEQECCSVDDVGELLARLRDNDLDINDHVRVLLADAVVMIEALAHNGGLIAKRLHDAFYLPDLPLGEQDAVRLFMTIVRETK